MQGSSLSTTAQLLFPPVNIAALLRLKWQMDGGSCCNFPHSVQVQPAQIIPAAAIVMFYGVQ